MCPSGNTNQSSVGDFSYYKKKESIHNIFSCFGVTHCSFSCLMFLLHNIPASIEIYRSLMFVVSFLIVMKHTFCPISKLDFYLPYNCIGKIFHRCLQKALEFCANDSSQFSLNSEKNKSSLAKKSAFCISGILMCFLLSIPYTNCFV